MLGLILHDGWIAWVLAAWSKNYRHAWPTGCALRQWTSTLIEHGLLFNRRTATDRRGDWSSFLVTLRQATFDVLRQTRTLTSSHILTIAGLWRWDLVLPGLTRGKNAGCGLAR